MKTLAKFFGTKDGQPEALTYEELIAKIEADNTVKLVDLSEGGYVSKDKYDAADTELKGVKKQLADAQAEIKSYQDMDIDGIKKAAADYETKSKDEISKLQKQLEDQKIAFAEDKFLSKYQFVDDFAKAGVAAEFRSKGFKYDEDSGAFLGAEEYMKGIMESHKAAFVPAKEPEQTPEENPQPQQPEAPRYTFLGKPGNQGGGTGAAENPFGWNFAGVRPKNNNS